MTPIMKDAYDGRLAGGKTSGKNRAKREKIIARAVRHSHEPPRSDLQHAKVFSPHAQADSMVSDGSGKSSGSSERLAKDSSKLVEEHKEDGLKLLIPKIEISQPYLNDYPKKCKFRDRDPVVIMECTLKDLVILLNTHKSKGSHMFYSAHKSKYFATVEREIASFRDEDFFTSAKDRGEHFLATNEEKLCFFVNLLNFLVLYGLCKRNIKTLPSTQLEWTNFLKSVSMRMAGFTFTAFEIKYTVLRASMPDHKMPNPYLDVTLLCSKYIETDQKAPFAYDRREAYISFAMYLPVVSSSPLRIYKPETVTAQMKANATEYLQKTVKLKKNNVLILPECLEWYRDDFLRGSDENDLILFVANCLSKNSSPELTAFFRTSGAKEIQYEKFNWDFKYDYVK